MNSMQRTVPMGRLAGRRILVTGGASGIGKATSALFAAEGARIVIADQDAKAAVEIATAIGGSAVEADITREADVEAAVERASQIMSGLDGLVNAAGIMSTGAILDMPVDLWRRIVEVNLVGTYLVTRSCISRMRAAGAGTIVNIASAQGLLPNAPNRTADAASKGGVINLSRALAAELAPVIRVNTVCPGTVDTSIANGQGADISDLALKRIAHPLEIARAILFLTSSESSYATGVTLAIDGGRSFH